MIDICLGFFGDPNISRMLLDMIFWETYVRENAQMFVLMDRFLGGSSEVSVLRVTMDEYSRHPSGGCRMVFLESCPTSVPPFRQATMPQKCGLLARCRRCRLK